MEFGLREWLIVIGIIVIAGILFDGWRRMRGGKGKLKFRLDRSFANMPDDDSDPDLLSTPRVVNRDHEPQLDEDELPSMSAKSTCHVVHATSRNRATSIWLSMSRCRLCSTRSMTNPSNRRKPPSRLPMPHR